MINRSEIMRTAWTIYKGRSIASRFNTFAQALKRAWQQAKIAIKAIIEKMTKPSMKYVSPSDIKAGDILCLQELNWTIGEYEKINRVVASISLEVVGFGLDHYVVHYEDGTHSILKKGYPVQKIS